MQHIPQKSHIMQELAIDRQAQIEEERRKINAIKQQIKNYQLTIADKDQKLLQYSITESKRVMAERRQLSQPIRLEQLKIHQQQYDSQQLLKDRERQIRKEQSITVDYPKSKTYLRLEQEELNQKAKEYQEQQKKYQQKQMQSKYSELVNSIILRPPGKSVHLSNPTLAQQISKQTKAMSQHQNEIPLGIAQSLKPVDKYMLKKLEKILNTKPNTFETKLTSGKKQQSQRIFNQIENSQISIQESKVSLPKAQKPNYRLEISKHRKLPEFKVTDWRNIIQDQSLSDNSRVEQAMNQIKEIHDKANKLEVLLGGQLNIQREEEFNDLMVNSVQAKLALLDSFEK